MSAGTEVTPFHWGDIALSETVFIDGTPHATRFAIGEWLEYADPQNAMDVILKRNPYIEAHSLPVRLSGKTGQEFDTKVYHPIGYLLIVMESGQPKAQAMKQAVAEFVWHFAGPKRMSFKERQDLVKTSCGIAGRLAENKDAFVRDVLVSHLREVHLALGQPLPDLARLGKDVDQLALPGV